MIAKLMGKEEVNAALAVAITGAIAVLAAKGDGPLSLGRVVSGVLSNPVPRRVQSDVPLSAPSGADLGLAA